MLHLPFFDFAFVWFEPFVISASIKMSLCASEQSLTEGVWTDTRDIDTWHLELHKFFRQTRKGGSVEAWRLTRGSCSSFAWQRQLPEEKMESEQRRDWGSRSRGDVLPTECLVTGRQVASEDDLLRFLTRVWWCRGLMPERGETFRGITLFVWDYWGCKQTPTGGDISQPCILNNQLICPVAEAVSVNHLLWFVLGVCSRNSLCVVGGSSESERVCVILSWIRQRCSSHGSVTREMTKSPICHFFPADQSPLWNLRQTKLSSQFSPFIFHTVDLCCRVTIHVPRMTKSCSSPDLQFKQKLIMSLWVRMCSSGGVQRFCVQSYQWLIFVTFTVHM